MRQQDSTTLREQRGSKLGDELRALFDGLRSESIIARLQEYRWTGRPGHSLTALWRAFIASYFLNLPHTNALIRRLEDDPALRDVCGFSDVLPSRWTFNRFLSRLARHPDLVDGCLREITAELRDRLPGFGETVAIDSSTIRTHADPNKPVIADPDASWTAKASLKGKHQTEWRFGYKLHLMTDARWELPITGYVTTARQSDTKNFIPLLVKAKEEHDWFAPKHVVADRGYDATTNYRAVAEVLGAIPIILIRKRHKWTNPDIYDGEGVPHCVGGKAMRLVGRDEQGAHFRCPPEGCHLKGRSKITDCDAEESVKPSDDYRLFCEIPRSTPEWQALYNRRTSIERVFSRLKEARRLERHCVRTLPKVTLHALLSVLVLQADALAKADAGRLSDVRACTRRVA